LDLSWCSELKELPTSIDKLCVLQTMYLLGCSEFKELPIPSSMNMDCPSFVEFVRMFTVEGDTDIY
jgi:hypothetical protein